MYDDDAGWRGHFNLLSALYRDHPIRLDIPGTKQTIAPIDRDVLLRTHAAYYHPANLVLVVAGDVDPGRVLALASERLAASAPGAAHRRAPVAEPDAPAVEERRQGLSVSRPQVSLGIKDAAPGVDGDALVALDAETDLLLDVLFGDGGRVQAPLYREGLVDEGFGASFHAGPDYAFVTVAAEVDEEGPYRARLLELLDAAARTPITEAEVERSRRRGIGGWLRTFNAPEGVAGLHLGLHMRGASLSAPLDALRAATPRRLDERLAALRARGRAWSVIHPKATA
jgi:predicted Zn-dependent peptidase